MTTHILVIDQHKLPAFEAALMEAGFTDYTVSNFFIPKTKIIEVSNVQDYAKLKYLRMKTNLNTPKPESDVRI